jgi:hypothetical protein
MPIAVASIDRNRLKETSPYPFLVTVVIGTADSNFPKTNPFMCLLFSHLSIPRVVEAFAFHSVQVPNLKQNQSSID